MTFDLPPVSELPSGTTQETGNFPVANYAHRYLSPCEAYACVNAARCRDELLACRSFASWVGRAYSRNPKPPTEPSAAIFAKIFNEDDDE